MKFIPDAVQGPTITGYGPGWVEVNGEKHHSSIVLSSQGICQPWPCAGFEELALSHFEALAAFESELVLFGSGSSIRFPHPQWLTPLYSRRIGLETMDTQAACRTYNFLSGEGRRVVAALII